MKNPLKSQTLLKECFRYAKALIESIDKLNEMCGESQEAKGLNSSIDTLSKVNSTQVTALSSLSGQVSNLARITAHNYQMQNKTKN